MVWGPEKKDWKPGYLIVYEGKGKTRSGTTYPVTRRSQVFTKFEIRQKNIKGVKLGRIQHIDGKTRVQIKYKYKRPYRGGKKHWREGKKEVTIGYSKKPRIVPASKFKRYKKTGPTR